MAAIWLNVVLGVITALTGGLAGHLASQNAKHKWAFWSAAFVSVLLFIIQGFLIQRDTREAEEHGKSEQAQLNRIEQKAGQPPVVNVNTPPASPATSNVSVDRIETARVLNNTGQRVWLVPGQDIQANIYSANTGQGTADMTRQWGRIYLVDSDPNEPDADKENEKIEDVKKLTPRFRKALAKINHTSMLLSANAANHVWFTPHSERAITQDDITKLESGGELLFLFYVIEYRDSSGSHYSHHCIISQPPAFNPPIWQLCQGFEDHK